MTYSDILLIMSESYIADSGLGRIDLDDTTILANGVESCRNENGILFLAYMLAHSEMYKPEGFNLTPVVAAALRTVGTLQTIPDTKGLYNRQPGGLYGAPERHDNYIGICTASVLFGDVSHPRAMISHWWRNKFCFNNVEPGKFSWAQFRQPGELAVYYVAAGRNPPMLFMLWLLVGLFINGYSKEVNPPEARLTWLRTFIIDRKIDSLGFVKRFLYRRVAAYWNSRVVKKYGSHDAIWGFPSGHPIRLFRGML